MIWFIHTTAPSPVTYLPQRSVIIFIMCLRPYRIQPTHNLKVKWCWGGESPRTACLTCYQKLPETRSLSLPRTPTSPALLPPKGLQQRGPSLPAAIAGCDHDHYSHAEKGWLNKTRAGGWSLRKFTLLLNPRMSSTASLNRKPEDTSAESHACKNNVHEISLWPQLQQAQQTLHCSWWSPKSQLCLIARSKMG